MKTLMRFPYKQNRHRCYTTNVAYGAQMTVRPTTKEWDSKENLEIECTLSKEICGGEDGSIQERPSSPS